MKVGVVCVCRYVMESILEIERRGGDIWFISLRQQPYKEAWSQLQQLTGVGAKVIYLNTIT